MPIPTGDRPFDRLAAELVAAQLEAAPVLGSFLGLTAYDGALTDMSAGAIAARERADDAWKERFAALPDADLTADEQVDRDLVVMVLTGRQVMRDWQGWRRNPDDYAGPALNGLHILLLHGLRRPEPLARAIVSRLEGIPDLLAAGRANLDAELAAPELVRRAQGMARAGAPSVRSLHTQVEERYAGQVAEAAEPAAAAFEEWAAFLDGLAEKATGGWAIGEERYDGLLRHAEGLDYGARELR
jgi:uncharacterized protein (DUF885 family)